MKDKDYRSLIIQVAEEIINRQGMKSLTISNIVQRSKISNRNFYESFSSKEELLLEIKKRCNLDGFEIPDEKQTILEKAEEGISHYGFNNITLESIAKSAGLKRGAIYKHFSDKYELLECCIEYQFNKTKQIMNLVFQANEQDPENYIRKYVENYAYFLNNTFDSSIFTESWSHMNYRPKIRELALDLQENFRSHIADCLKSGIEQGVFKKDLDLATVTEYISIMINGMAFFISKRPLVGERITKDVVDLMLASFFTMIKVEKDK
ncbi:MAG TPA: TetR/AcrR family transcriptional regulator [Anaerovoracaceae bacterium]|nr:TetR/AcrR family transcriptional regulator [Anaerovoracaceae bacterium]